MDRLGDTELDAYLQPVKLQAASRLDRPAEYIPCIIDILVGNVLVRIRTLFLSKVWHTEHSMLININEANAGHLMETARKAALAR